MLVPWVGCFERIRVRIDLEHQVHKVAELEIMYARRHIRAVAGVKAHAVRWYAAQRVVDHLHALPDKSTTLLDRNLRMTIPVRRQTRVVDLQNEACGDDRLIL